MAKVTGPKSEKGKQYVLFDNEVCVVVPPGTVCSTAFQCTSHISHQNPGKSPRVVRKIYSNAPSEVDHPMFGIHDPFRAERLGPNPTGTSMYQDVFIPPDKSKYSYQSAEAPYPDDRDKFNFNKKDTMGSHLSEQQSRYQWPAWSVPLKPIRHKNELAIE